MSFSGEQYSDYYQSGHKQSQSEQDQQQLEIQDVPSPMHLISGTKGQYDRDNKKWGELGNYYDLTFKKQSRGQLFAHQNTVKEVSPQRKLFLKPSQQIEETLSTPIEEFYEAELQQLQKKLIPRSLLEMRKVDQHISSLKLSQSEIKKLRFIMQIYNLKVVKLKYRNCQFNLQVSLGRQNKNQEQKYKQVVLMSLVSQLRKKCFVEALKFNLYQKRYFESQKVSSSDRLDQAHDPVMNQSSDTIEITDQNQFLNTQFKPKIEKKENVQEIQNSSQPNKECSNVRGVIINQILTTIIKSRLNSVLKEIKFACGHRQESLNGNSGEYSMPSLPYRLRGNEQSNSPSNLLMQEDMSQQAQHHSQQRQDIGTEEQSEYTESQLPSRYYDEGQSGIHQQMLTTRQQKVQEIRDFIKHLQTSNRNDGTNNGILRDYFCKWRIFFLGRMISLIQRDISQNPMQEQRPSESYNPQQIIEESYYDGISQGHIDSFQPSHEIDQFASPSTQSNAKGSLKEEKTQLKGVIYLNEARLFLRQLHQFSSYKKITRISNHLRNQNLTKRAFEALLWNVGTKNRQSQLAEHFQSIAQNQDQDDIESQLFYKTNLIIRVFMHLKNLRICGKMFRAVDALIKREVFQKINMKSTIVRRQEENFKKHGQLRQELLKFKAFSILKSGINQDRKNLARVHQFKIIKRMQTLEYYFNVLKLEAKRTLIKTRKAQKYKAYNLMKKVFGTLKLNSHRSAQTNKKAQALYQAFSQLTKVKTIKQFKAFYEKQVNSHDVQVLTYKISNQLLKKRIKKGLTDWRKWHLRKETYRAIEVRLARLTEKERMRRIYSMWYEKAISQQQQRRDMEFSGKHNNWLKNYYSNLCQISK